MNAIIDHSQLHKDILCTAIEGGITYWAAWKHAETLPRAEPVYPGDFDYVGLTGVCDREDGSPFPDIDLNTVALGIERLTTGTVKANERYAKAILQAIDDPENSGVYIDADIADCIVQAGLFNDIVYG